MSLDYKRLAAGLIQGGLLGGVTIVTVTAAMAPGRYGVAHHEAQFGASIHDQTLAGLARDLTVMLPWLAAGIGVLWGLTLLLSFWRPAYFRSKWAHILLFIAPFFMFWFCFWLLSTSIAEFKIQRGIYPSRYDLVTGADIGFVTSTLPIFWADRYLPATLMGLTLLLILLFSALAVTRSRPFTMAPSRFFGFGALVGISFTVVNAIDQNSPAWFDSIKNREDVAFPLERFALDFGYFQGEAIGVRVALEQADYGEEMIDSGAKMSGFSQIHAENVQNWLKSTQCDNHPLRRPLDFATGSGPSVIDGKSGELLAALREVSSHLFANPDSKVSVWHLIMESYRADDMAAWNNQAPVELAPYTNNLYAAAQIGEGGVLAANNMNQAAVRTTHALAASMCGIGSLPLALSIARDLGNVPLRCLPDLLSDGGYSTRFFYGANLDFDNMRSFLRYHGFATYEDRDYPADAPQGFWAVADLAMVTGGIAMAQKKATAANYNVFLSISNHDPFQLPDDTPDLVKERVATALMRDGRRFADDHTSRLLTYSYSDYTIQAGMETVLAKEGPGEINIFVAHGDHATNDFFLWRKETRDRNQVYRSLSQVPFFIKLPDAPPAGGDQAAYQRAVAKAARLMIDLPLSVNDIPALLTALLIESPGLRNVPPTWRWVTYGGQQTSPDYAYQESGATVWGFNARSQLYLVDDDGQVSLTGEEFTPLDNYEVLTDPATAALPVAAFLGSFLRGYGTSCWSSKNIRGS